MGHCVAQTVNTICFEGFARVRLSGFGVPLGCHLGSLLDTLVIHGRILAARGAGQNVNTKKVVNRRYDTVRAWMCGSLKR